MRSKIVISSRGKFTYFINDKEVSEKEFKKTCCGTVQGACATTMLQSSKSWPKKSDACGVHPRQVEDAYEASVKLGVATEFDRETGQAIFRDNAHQREFLRAHGYRNNDGGYGQITG